MDVTVAPEEEAFNSKNIKVLRDTGIPRGILGEGMSGASEDCKQGKTQSVCVP